MATDLEVATRDLAIALGSVAEDLRALGYGVSAQVPVTETHQLRFCKQGRRWGLFAVDEYGAYTALDEMPREFLHAAAQQLPQMHDALHQAALAELEEVKAARQKVAQFIVDVKSGKYSR